MSAPFILAPLFALLKSGTVIKAISVIGRLSLALITPLRLGASSLLKWWHGPDHIILYPPLPPPDSSSGESGGKQKQQKHRHFRRTTIALISLPIGLLAVALLASLERTPFSGRWRIILMSTDEEELLISSTLSPGSPGSGPRKDEGGRLKPNLDAGAPRDWCRILRVLNNESADAEPPGMVSGFLKVSEEEDWRVGWVQDVLRRLEAAVQDCKLTDPGNLVRDVATGVHETRFVVPAVEHPLAVRPALLKHHGHDEDADVNGPLVTNHACIVFKSPITNAFGLGFGPVINSDERPVSEAPGVIVVYTGGFCPCYITEDDVLIVN